MGQEKTEDPKLEISFIDFAKRSPQINLSIIASPDDLKVMDFLGELYQSRFTKDLYSETIRVKLGYTILHCSSCEEKGYNMRKENCLSGGRYCMRPTNNNAVTGEVMLIQAVKNLCTDNHSAA